MLLNHTHSQIVRPRVPRLDDNPATPEAMLERFHQRFAEYRIELRQWQRRLWAQGENDPVLCVISEMRAEKIAAWCVDCSGLILADVNVNNIDLDTPEGQTFYADPWADVTGLRPLALEVAQTAHKLLDSLPCE